MTEEVIDRLTDAFFARMRLPAPIREDETERSMMAGWIISGAEKLNDVACGQDIDYEADNRASELLYNWCFYSRNDAQDKFNGAYSADLNELRQRARLGKVKVITA